MTRGTLIPVIFLACIALLVFGILAFMGGPLAALSMSPFLVFAIVGTVIIAFRQGKTWRNFLDD